MSMDRGTKPQISPVLREKVLHEAKAYGIVFAYLYVCFGAIIFYRDAVLQADGIPYADYGVAVVKAAILGKFMLLGQAARLGERWKVMAPIPALAILRKASFFLILLVVLTIVEEAVVALIHGRGIVRAISEVAGGSWQQRIATCLLLWLILMPYFIIRKIAELLRPGVLGRMLFSRQ
jgi:hypothetical protein